MHGQPNTLMDFPRPMSVWLAEAAEERVAWITRDKAELVPGVELVMPRIGLLCAPAHLVPTYALLEEIAQCTRNGERARAAMLQGVVDRRAVAS